MSNTDLTPAELAALEADCLDLPAELVDISTLKRFRFLALLAMAKRTAAAEAERDRMAAGLATAISNGLHPQCRLCGGEVLARPDYEAECRECGASMYLHEAAAAGLAALLAPPAPRGEKEE